MAGGTTMNEQVSMETLAEEYLTFRRSQGFLMKIEGQLLLNFARYADQHHHSGPLSIELATRWARLPEKGSALYWAKRLDIVRGFSRYRSLFDSATEVPSVGLLGPSFRRTTPYIYSDEQICELLKATSQMRPRAGLRPKTYATLFGLLASTGMRVSEALKLTRMDVDFEQGVIRISSTKFYKSRLVPLHPSATSALKIYSDLRDAYHPKRKSDAFFVGEKGTGLKEEALVSRFQRLRSMLWKWEEGQRPPRVYDLRHTFVCRRILQWYTEGVDVTKHMLALSTYLGHSEVKYTYWYLTGTPQLMALISDKFEHFMNARGSE